MNHDSQDPVQTLRSELLAQKGALTEPILSLYVNYYNDLSQTERNLIESRLTHSKDAERFATVFDDEMAMDPAVMTVDLHAEKDGQFEGGGLVLHAVLNQKGLQLKWGSLPDRFVHQKGCLDASSKRFRMVSMDPNMEFSWPIAELPSAIRLSAVPKPASSARILTFLPQVWMRYAAAAIVVMAATSFLVMRSGDPQPVVVEQRPVRDSLIKNIERTPEKEVPVKAPVHEPKLMAAAFEANPILENYVSRNYRSEAGIEITGPKNSDTINLPITFSWNAPEDQTRVELSIVDNTNRKIWEGYSENTQLIYQGPLKPGLYYWMAKTGGELKSVRKFYILQ